MIVGRQIKTDSVLFADRNLFSSEKHIYIDVIKT